MTFTTTVEGIMTTQLYTWNRDEQSQEDVVAYARKMTYDTVPMSRNGHIEGIFYVATGECKPITQDLLLTRDTPIPDAVALLSASQHPSLLVLYQQAVKGILTPSDFNKVLARSYFYNLLAQLEMLLADCTREHYQNTDEIVKLVKTADKTVAQYRKKILSRSSGAERKQFNLDLIHNLTLDELECLVLRDEGFRQKLGFRDPVDAERLLNGVNNGFRRKIMHPTRPLLSDDFGLAELNSYMRQVVKLLDLLTNAQLRSHLVSNRASTLCSALS